VLACCCLTIGYFGVVASLLARDVAGARVLVRSQHRELLESLLQAAPEGAARAAAPRVTLRAASKPEKTVLQSWLDAAGLRARVLTASEVRGSERFEVCYESPLPDELREVAQLDALLQRARTHLAAEGILWCVVPYDLLEAEGAPPLRLRAHLAESGFECLALVPLEAEGRHVLLARSRLRMAATAARSLSA